MADVHDKKTRSRNMAAIIFPGQKHRLISGGRKSPAMSRGISEIMNSCWPEGWRIAFVWECALKCRHKRMSDAVIGVLVDWFGLGQPSAEIGGEV